MERIYLDNASTSFPKAEGVAEAVYQYIKECGCNINRGGYDEAYQAEELVLETRQRLTALFHGPDCRNVAFTRNITESLNVLLKGFLRPGDHVLVSAMEHNAVMRPLTQLQSRGVSFDRIPCAGDGTLDTSAMAALLRDNTRAVVMLHASNVCGTVLPAAEVGAFCHAHGLKFILDAAQTAGVLPIDMEQMHIDVLCFTGHKSLMGPQGTGGLCVREGVDINPWKVGGTGVQTYLHEQPEQMPTRLEAGTLNGHGIAGLNAALDFLQETGVEAIHAHEMALLRRFVAGVKKIPGVALYGDFDHERTAVAALNIGDMDSGEVSDILSEDYGIATRPGAHCAPRLHKALGTEEQGAVRFSFGWYNTEEEADAAVNALREIAT